MATYIQLKCPGCGADLSIEKGGDTYFCKYCGTRIFVENPNEKRTRVIDEAKVRQVELEQEKFNYYKAENEELEEKYLRWRKMLLYWLGAMGICFFMTMLNGYGWLYDLAMSGFTALLVFGGAALLVTKPRKSGTSYIESRISLEEGPYSEKSWVVTVILWAILGIFGAHQFYVRRYGWGILYLFTGALFGIGWIYDIIKLVKMDFRDYAGCPVVLQKNMI